MCSCVSSLWDGWICRLTWAIEHLKMMSGIGLICYWFGCYSCPLMCKSEGFALPYFVNYLKGTNPILCVFYFFSFLSNLHSHYHLIDRSRLFHFSWKIWVVSSFGFLHSGLLWSTLPRGYCRSFDLAWVFTRFRTVAWGSYLMSYMTHLADLNRRFSSDPLLWWHYVACPFPTQNWAASSESMSCR